MAGKLAPHVAEGAIVLLAVGLAFGAAVLGFAVGREWGDDGPAVAAAATPAGHSGSGLPPHEFGDPAVGVRLFVSKGVPAATPTPARGAPTRRPSTS